MSHKSPRRGILWTAPLMLAALALVAGCGTASSQNAAATVKGGSMAVRLAGDWDSWDPHQVRATYASQMSSALFDRLVDLDAKGQVVPYLAKSWKQTPTSITFSLQNGVTCSDGTKLTTTAVAANFQRMFKAYPGGAVKLFGNGPFNTSANDAAGSFTLSSQSPYGDMLFGFANTDAEILCPAAIRDGPDKNPVGTGPFTIVSAVHGDHVTMKGRPEWSWGPAGTTALTAGFPDQITFKPISNETTAANLVTTGGVDLTQVNGPDATRLIGNKSLLRTVSDPFNVNPLVFNNEAPHVTTDPKVREALMTAVDPKAYAKAAYGDLSVTSPTMLTPLMHCYDPATAKLMPRPSTQKARAILLADGYTAGSGGKLEKNGKPLTIKLNATSSNVGAGGEYVASQFDQAGITVSYTDLDFNTFVANSKAGNFDASLLQLSTTGPAPSIPFAYVSGVHGPVGLNNARTTDPELDQEITLGQAAVGDESCKHWDRVQELVLINHDFLPMANSKFNWFGRGVSLKPSKEIDVPFVRRVR